MAQLSVAVCYGRLAPLEDNKTRINDSRLLKGYLDQALELNPRNDLAWYVLGEWNYELASLNAFMRTLARVIYGEVPSASYDDAQECFKKALALNPNQLSYYIELGRTQLALGDQANARTNLQRGFAMPDHLKDDAFVKDRARPALQSLK
ncbi:MAG: hypothetical protein QM796_03800 [Chthoniobacteraceae bacterium]